MGQQSFIRTALSGMTLGALYFMVAAGLTIIFGLMDVLNFAHGAMFMIGAYMGWQFYTNPTFLFGILPLVLAFADRHYHHRPMVAHCDEVEDLRTPGRNACAPS